MKDRFVRRRQKISCEGRGHCFGKSVSCVYLRRGACAQQIDEKPKRVPESHTLRSAVLKTPTFWLGFFFLEEAKLSFDGRVVCFCSNELHFVYCDKWRNWQESILSLKIGARRSRTSLVPPSFHLNVCERFFRVVSATIRSQKIKPRMLPGSSLTWWRLTNPTRNPTREFSSTKKGFMQNFPKNQWIFESFLQNL